MKQITEDYCSFEVAKLLKEKGFDTPCRQAYFKDLLVDYTMYGFCDGELIDCPSQSLALKWLREVHNIHITILQIESTTITMEQKYFFYRIQKNRRTVGIFEDTFLKYEQAIEAALNYVLKNLI